MKRHLNDAFREGLAAGFGALSYVYARPRPATSERRGALASAVKNVNAAARRQRRGSDPLSPMTRYPRH